MEAKTDLAERAGEALSRIETVVLTVAERVHNICAAAEEMTAASDDVSRSMADVAAIVEESSATAEEMSASAEQVSASVQTVAGTVGQQDAPRWKTWWHRPPNCRISRRPWPVWWTALQSVSAEAEVPDFVSRPEPVLQKAA